MPSAKTKPAQHKTSADSTRAVDEFMRALDHPFKQEIEAIRRLILGADTAIAEGIKWNAPSFRTGEYFATTNLREKKGVGVVFHLGAKVRKLPADGLAMEDPTKLLEWIGKDRAMVVFRNLEDVNAKSAALVRIVQQWILHVGA
jgi:hypothetical protein